MHVSGILLGVLHTVLWTQHTLWIHVYLSVTFLPGTTRLPQVRQTQRLHSKGSSSLHLRFLPQVFVPIGLCHCGALPIVFASSSFAPSRPCLCWVTPNVMPPMPAPGWALNLCGKTPRPFPTCLLLGAWLPALVAPGTLHSWYSSPVPCPSRLSKSITLCSKSFNHDGLDHQCHFPPWAWRDRRLGNVSLQGFISHALSDLLAFQIPLFCCCRAWSRLGYKYYVLDHLGLAT
jgi:hypothetical protein